MKSILTISLLCVSIATNAQQLPKSADGGISDKLKLEKNLPPKPMPQIGENSIQLFNRNEFLHENLTNNSSLFKNKALLEHFSKKTTDFSMPIVDTKNDNSVMKIWMPDALQSNMPIVKTFSHW